MKVYVKATTQKPRLDHVKTSWSELEDGTGILFSIYSEDDRLLFEQYFDYTDVDFDAIYDSAINMAETCLSLEYKLSEDVLNEIRRNKL